MVSKHVMDSHGDTMGWVSKMLTKFLTKSIYDMTEVELVVEGFSYRGEKYVRGWKRREIVNN